MRLVGHHVEIRGGFCSSEGPTASRGRQRDRAATTSLRWQQDRAGQQARAGCIVVNSIFEQLRGRPCIRFGALQQLARKDLRTNGAVNAATVAGAGSGGAWGLRGGDQAAGGVAARQRYAFSRFCILHCLGTRRWLRPSTAAVGCTAAAPIGRLLEAGVDSTLGGVDCG